MKLKLLSSLTEEEISRWATHAPEPECPALSLGNGERQSMLTFWGCIFGGFLSWEPVVYEDTSRFGMDKAGRHEQGSVGHFLCGIMSNNYLKDNLRDFISGS